MKPILVIGIIVVNLALLSYSLFIFNEHKKKSAHRFVLLFLTLGLLLDIIATTCMIIGSEKSPFTVHGILGYSSLTGMLLDGLFIWKHKFKVGSNVHFSKALNLYSKCAYGWWVLAYITGAVIVAVNRG